jgi:hypothetical protein
MINCPKCNTRVGELFSECPNCDAQLRYQCENCGCWYYYADGGCTTCGKEIIGNHRIMKLQHEKVLERIEIIKDIIDRLRTLIVLSLRIGSENSIIIKQNHIVEYLLEYLNRYFAISIKYELDVLFERELTTTEQEDNLETWYNRFVKTLQTKIEIYRELKADEAMMKNIEDEYKGKLNGIMQIIVATHTNNIIADISPVDDKMNEMKLQISSKNSLKEIVSLDYEFDRFIAENDIK